MGSDHDQWQYEAYEVKPFPITSRSGCVRRPPSVNSGRDAYECVATGWVAAKLVGPLAIKPEPAEAAVYSDDGNGLLRLLGNSSITDHAISADIVSVSFQWPEDVQSVVLLYIRSSTSNYNITLTSRSGTNTNRFHLEDPNVCQICRSSARVIRNMNISNSLDIVAPTESE